MRVTLSQVVYRTLLIYSPTTGGLAAPDATPSASVVKNGTTDGAVTVTVTNVSTGRYKLSFTVPGTYAVDDVLELVATWAISSVDGAKLWAMQVDNTVASVKAKTDNLPSDPADASDIAASFSTVNSSLSTIAAYIDTEIAAIKAKTDNLPADPADASDIAASFSSISTSLTTLAGYVDTEVAAILAAVDTEVAAIKAKTDLITGAPAVAGDAMTLTSAYDAAKVAASATNLATAQTDITTIKTNTRDLPAMTENDGTVSARFTAAALALAPSASGSLSTDERYMICLIAAALGVLSGSKTYTTSSQSTIENAIPNIDLTDSGDVLRTVTNKESDTVQEFTTTIV